MATPCRQACNNVPRSLVHRQLLGRHAARALHLPRFLPCSSPFLPGEGDASTIALPAAGGSSSELAGSCSSAFEAGSGTTLLLLDRLRRGGAATAACCVTLTPLRPEEGSAATHRLVLRVHRPPPPPPLICPGTLASGGHCGRAVAARASAATANVVLPATGALGPRHTCTAACAARLRPASAVAGAAAAAGGTVRVPTRGDLRFCNFLRSRLLHMPFRGAAVCRQG